MIRNDTETPCGPLCSKLSVKHHAFHLAWLEHRDDQQAYESVPGYRQRGPAAAAGARRLRARADIHAAISWHLRRVGEGADSSLEAIIQRLAIRASATLADFVEVHTAEISRERLEDIASLDDPEERRSQIQRLQQIEVIPWKTIPPAKLAAVAEISQSRDGAVRLKLEPRNAADAQIAKLLGYEPPTEVRVVRMVEEQVAARQRDLGEAVREIRPDLAEELAVVLEEINRRRSP